MRFRVKNGDEFEIEVVTEQDKNVLKIIALVVVAVILLVGGLAAYVAVEGDFTAYGKTLDTIVKLAEVTRYDW